MNRRRLIAASAGAFPALHVGLLLAAPPKGIPGDAEEATFTSAVDGEKFKGRIGDKEREIRLIGVDAPEKTNKDGNSECYFDQSSKRLTQLLNNHKIYLEKDQEDKDGKGRLWRHVWVVSAAGKAILANEFFLAEGTVVTRSEDKNTKYKDRYTSAEASAKSDGKGLWDMCGSAHLAITPVPRHGSGDDPGVAGETLVAEGVAVTLNSYYYDYSYGYSMPKRGYMYLIVDVTIKNTNAKGDKGYDEGRFSARDLDTGTNYDSVGSAIDAPLGNDQLSPGEYVGGVVGIEIQETATNVRLKYQISFAGSNSVYWLVPRK